MVVIQQPKVVFIEIKGELYFVKGKMAIVHAIIINRKVNIQFC